MSKPNEQAGARSAGEVVVRVEGVSKKFCRSLKKSLWYGVCDIGAELLLRPKSYRDIRQGQEPANTNSRADFASWRGGRDESWDNLRPSEFWALQNVSFHLRRGECLGLIGHNGAGKTTLLKMLNGLAKIDRGRIEMKGRIGALIALGAGFNPLLTGRENIYVNGSVLGLSKRQIEAKMDEILDFADLGEFINAPVRNYSSGMNVRLGFAVAAVLIEPDVLFLDEVLAVGDIGFKYKCFAAIERLMRNSAVVLVSHDMGQVQRICTSIMFLAHGRVQYHGEDVAEGIQRYQASLIGEGQEKIAGTGRATLSEISVSAANHPRVNELGLPLIAYGEDMHIEFDLDIDVSVHEVTVVVNLLNQAGVAVAQCNSADQGFSVCNRGVRTKISMRFPRLPLNPGIYRLWIIVRSARRPEPLTVHYGVVPFQVIGDFVGYIAFQPLVTWHASTAT